ncbi:cobyrinic acid a,c-diamide synthase cbia putative [Heliomicrobium modesticaldum Ice1]|uniref:Cobyrinate a,c-diamide synthase n=1 Tax=Heliobacterium modesticaldum (strain ATCC 51547 / Ice1) TaxID=498761 RepID=B0TIK8_HELMI|nr:cobyrinate a,c-diamide synthase [Heliomicrobium modesticaldum]ABZ84949.1 cobyrinic acid a,c-diamide synthase cbia putative [Heliomicrobium modesticaldum Ice1]
MIPSVVIAGTHSGAGKTTVTMGLLAALRRRGLTVQSFKAGPDYIDPTFHRLITGRICSNLDTWMMEAGTIKRLFRRAVEGAQVALIEGVMGLFDGAAGELPGGAGSTAALAALLQTPIVLVVDARSAAQSIAAVVYGFRHLNPALPVAGVIFNRVGSVRHGRMVRQAVEQTCRIPVLGCLPRDAVRPMPERHLGLVSAVERRASLEAYWQRLADVIEEHLDVDFLLEQMTVYAAKNSPREGEPTGNEKNAAGKLKSSAARVAIARDEAFHFYYEDALRDLAERGIEWVPFRPVAGEPIPAGIDGIYLGGGYPELYLEQLAANSAFLQELAYLHRNDMPIYAECGGFMTLCRSIRDSNGREYPLAALVPATCVMGEKRRALGYVTAEIAGDSLLGPRGDRLRGHEFHYSDISFVPGVAPSPAFILTKTSTAGENPESRPDGYSRGSLTASYFHFHFSAFSAAMDHFVDRLSSGRLSAAAPTTRPAASRQGRFVLQGGSGP